MITTNNKPYTASQAPVGFFCLAASDIFIFYSAPLACQGIFQ
jgi:hypothetical protein